jgi:hypothetical protein
MVDKQGRDQFVIKHGDEVVVLWNDGRRCRADEAYKRAFWTGGCSYEGCILLGVDKYMQHPGFRSVL